MVSIVTDSAGPADDWFPAGSLTFAVIDHEPADSVGRSHEEADPAVYEHVFVVAPFTAVNSTVSPAVAPTSVMVGVVSDVTLSESDDPRSDEATRSGVPGVNGAVVSTVSESEAPAADVLPAASVSVADTDHVPSVRVGRSHDAAGTT